MRTRKGFTLIELLVVIAIIAILAAILFPVFLSARDKARTVKCLSHGKELGSAVLMYMADNMDRFPSGTSAYSPEDAAKAQAYLESITWKYNWLGREGTMSAAGMCEYKEIQLKKYVKNDDIWICPSANGGYPAKYAIAYRCSWLPRSADGGGKGFIDGDRGFCEDRKPIPGWDPNHTGAVGLTLGEVQSHDSQGNADCGPRYMPPSRKIMYMCYAIGRLGASMFPRTGGPWDRITYPSYSHADGSTFVYADGHASFQKMGQGWAPLGYTNNPIDLKP